MKAKIKTWEEHEKEFGINEDGEIVLPDRWVFTREMESYMPEDRIVDIEKDTTGDYFWDNGFIFWYLGRGSIAYFVQETDAEEIAAEHWEYVKNLLTAHGGKEEFLEVLEFHYKTAFVHGYKHGAEERRV